MDENVRKKRIHFLLPQRPAGADKLWFYKWLKFLTFGLYWLNLINLLSAGNGLINLRSLPFEIDEDKEEFKVKSKDYVIEPDWDSDFNYV